VFSHENDVLALTLAGAGTRRHKVLCVIDEGVAQSQPGFAAKIASYFDEHRSTARLVAAPLIVPGGESAKNTMMHVQRIQKAIHDNGICRQSFVIAVGGGALLDMAGFAAAVAHRGVRLIRVPTTALSQDDSGVGVKNAVNNFEKKNFTGTFAPPYAVINDFAFLETLSQRDWISGLAEAVKVALLKDAAFFGFLEEHAAALVAREAGAMRYAIYRSAELHVRHIGTAGDPFESSSSRPLDFGHWSAHKLELLTRFALRHGEAVAIGLALDTIYSWQAGMLSRADCMRVLRVLQALGFALYTPELESEPGQANQALLEGLRDFREHLGGELTLTLLAGIGRPVEVHSMDTRLIETAISLLRDENWMQVSEETSGATGEEAIYGQLSC
jgi:3-dehydroquinate synthase